MNFAREAETESDLSFFNKRVFYFQVIDTFFIKIPFEDHVASMFPEF